jgi:hypothetical protein
MSNTEVTLVNNNNSNSNSYSGGSDVNVRIELRDLTLDQLAAMDSLPDRGSNRSTIS